MLNIDDDDKKREVSETVKFLISSIWKNIGSSAFIIKFNFELSVIALCILSFFSSKVIVDASPVVPQTIILSAPLSIW